MILCLCLVYLFWGHVFHRKVVYGVPWKINVFHIQNILQKIDMEDVTCFLIGNCYIGQRILMKKCYWLNFFCQEFLLVKFFYQKILLIKFFYQEILVVELSYWIIETEEFCFFFKFSIMIRRKYGGSSQ